MRLLSTCLLLAWVSLIAVPGASAFDGDRRGFTLGFGAGPGMLAADFDFDMLWGLQTDLKIGAGVSEHTVFHYSGKQNWISQGDAFFTLANPMAGVTYYFRDGSPSPFVTGGAGLALAAAIWREEVGGGAGVGAFVGTGYEFQRHWNLEFNVIYNRFSLEGHLFNFALTLNVLGY